MAARLGLCNGGIDAVHGYGRLSCVACDTRIPVTQKSGGRCKIYAHRLPSRRLLCVGEVEPSDFWVRVQQAWRILIGTTTERQRVKQRFGNLLIRDRGFSSTNLARLYNVAKGAIEQHVDLEQDEDTEVTAYVEKFGKLRLDFRVKRVKSVLSEEPYAGVPRSSSDIESISQTGGLEKMEDEVEGFKSYGHQMDVQTALVPDLDLGSVIQRSTDVPALSRTIIVDHERTAAEVEK